VKIKADSIEKPKRIKPMTKVGGADSDRYVDSAMSVVWDLPEVKNLSRWFYKQQPDTSHHFALDVPDGPHKDFNYYWVRVGEDTPDHFGTYENFCVSSKDFTVYHYNESGDSVITIDQWRKSGKDKWYKKK